MRILLLLWAVSGAVSAQAGEVSAPPLPEVEAAPAASSEPEDGDDDEDLRYAPPARTPRVHLPDLTADVLQPGEGQFNLFYLQYSRGLLPGLQVSAHFGAYLITLLNLTAEYRFVELPELRASLQAGAYWFALSRLVQATILQAHLMPRATVPLGGAFELTVAANARVLVLNLPGVAQNTRDLRAELALIHHDDHGAWILEGRFPLLTHQTLQLDELLGQANVSGSLLLDDVGAWGVVVSRDQALGESMHVRLGLGYRNRPGILLVESVGNLLLQFDVYWR